MSEFDVDDLLPEEKPAQKPSTGFYGSLKLGTKDRKMGATAKEVGQLDDSAVVRIKALTDGSWNAPKISVRGYDYKSGNVLGTESLTPNIKHFEDMHAHAIELENHIERHQNLVNSSDLSGEDRAAANHHISRALDHLAQFHNVNSKALLAHTEGKTPTATVAPRRTDYSLAGAANHLTAAIDSLGSAHAAVGMKMPSLISNIKNKASNTVNEYLSEVGESRVASPERETSAPVQRLPMLGPAEREEQKARIAARRNRGPGSAVGAEQLMMGKKDAQVAAGPLPEGMVRTPSGGAAPEADVAAAHARQHSAQEEMVAKEHARAEEIRASRRPAAPQPKLSVITGGVQAVAAPRGPSLPLDKNAAQRIERINTPSPQQLRPTRFDLQQGQARAESNRILMSPPSVQQLMGETLRSKHAAEVDKVVYSHIAAGNYTAAAAHHLSETRNVSPAPGVKMYKKDAQAVREVLTDPVKYLSRNGYDLGEAVAQQVRQGSVRPTVSKPRVAKTEVRKPTTATVNPFTPQARAEYVEKDARMQEETRAKRRSGSFQEGQAK